MAKKLSSVLGIDIGSQTIKIAEIKTQARQPVVNALGWVETPEGAVDHTGIYNGEAVGAALKQALTDAGVTVKEAVVSIAGQGSVLVRTLEVPRMNPTELKEHMEWEINRNIPFSESNVMSDFKPLADDDPNSQNMEVVMALSPQSAIETLVSCVKKAGRIPAAIDVEPLSVARSLRTGYDDLLGGQTVCIVEVGHKTTAINIYRDGKLLMPRQILFGGEMFTKALADQLNLTFEEAERLKQEQVRIPESAVGGSAGAAFAPEPFDPQPYDPAAPAYGDAPSPDSGTQATSYNPFADDAPSAYDPAGEPAAESPYAYDQPVSEDESQASYDAGSGYDTSAFAPVPVEDPETLRFFEAIRPIVDDFVAEVRRSVDYFRSRGGEIDQILLCGGGTRVRGLAEYVSRTLGVPTEGYDAFRGLAFNEKKVAPGFAEERSQEFAIAVGNALHIFYE